MSQPFATIRSEGGLLPPDLLARIAQGDRTVPGFTPSAYRLDDGQQFGEAISRSWNRMLPAWHAFRAELAKLSSGDPATVLTREKLLQPLLQELGYGRVAPLKKAIAVDDREYAISHSWGDVPIHLLGAGTSLDERTAGQKGAAKSSPHGLVQDLLNRSEPHLWALLSNGLVLRLLRDHHSLTTQAYVEVDLEALFEGERYSDFALMWLVFHQSRIEPQDDKIDRCWLEQWFALSRTEGLQALDDLRDGVVAAIEALGRGFLKHAHNTQLAEDLREGVLDRQDYYRELLRLVYRLIFLFSTEDRGVLLDPNASEAARDRYRKFYATRRLRDLAGQTRGGPHGDLWQALRAVMNGLDDGYPPLALPALGSFLWSKEAVPHLDRCELANADLLAALRALSYVERHKQRFPVSWRTVAADELGSVYESLLELHPKLDPFELITAAGNERKKTGSYYTPTSLVDCLLDSALAPVIDSAIKGKSRTDAETALLALKVVDPACGSGHFLVAAARRLARRLATVRTGDDEPSPRELQHALRDVVGHCIYGVDLNAMAVELCKVALWMEAVEPGKPLSFLDAHIQNGNSLIGATPKLIGNGIPDTAWNAIEGDDDGTAAALKKRNRTARIAAEKSGQQDFCAALRGRESTNDLNTAARDALSGSDDDLADVRARERRWHSLQRSPAFREAIFIADTWCSAFVWRKQQGELAIEAPTFEVFAQVVRHPAEASKILRREVSRLAARYSFFHWHLAFPDVFARTTHANGTSWGGGFDCVLGNPPWERVTLEEREWFAPHNESISNAVNAAERKRLIQALRTEDPALHELFAAARRDVDAEKHFLTKSQRYPLAGAGIVNTFAIFLECMLSVRSSNGMTGGIFPTGIATTDNTEALFRSVLDTGQVKAFVDLHNKDGIFPGVQKNMRFCLFTIGAEDTAARFPVAAQLSSLDEARLPGRSYFLSRDDVEAVNPTTHHMPLFTNERDARLVVDIYRRHATVEQSGYGVDFTRMINMADDSKAFQRIDPDELRDVSCRDFFPWVRDGQALWPLYEAKLTEQYDHRAGTFLGTEPSRRYGVHASTKALTDEEHADPEFGAVPRYWLKDGYAREFKTATPFLVAYRDAVSAVADARSLAVVFLPQCLVGDTLRLIQCPTAEIAVAMGVTFNAMLMDYVFRQKCSGSHASQFILKQLPVLDVKSLSRPAKWTGAQTVLSWLAERALELSFTSWDLAAFGRACSNADAPFKWSEQRRHLLLGELDAAIFHLYGIERNDVEWVTGRFPIVERRDVQLFGRYRTRDTILEIYDEIGRAVDLGKPYETRLIPGPAHPSLMHSPSPARASGKRRR